MHETLQCFVKKQQQKNTLLSTSLNKHNQNWNLRSVTGKKDMKKVTESH